MVKDQTIDQEDLDSYVQILLDARRRGRSLDEQASSLKRMSLPVFHPVIDAAKEKIREEGRKNQLLKDPLGVESPDYRRTEGDYRHLGWYYGPRPTDEFYPKLERQMEKRLTPSALRKVDEASTKVVAYLGDPAIYGLSKKGLVLGYVQSGKTTNYAAVIAKAADAGYRMIIVLAGMHNGLRRQTQARLDRDVVAARPKGWTTLTSVNGDFSAGGLGGGLLGSKDGHVLIVVKKNAARLRNLIRWLSSISEPIRRECPTLIIDDEADQATPNTDAGRQKISTINGQLRTLIRLLPTSSYVAYTATPFANVLIDPDDSDDLYPRDFIIDLDAPEGYYGAEKIFGRLALDEADSPDDGLDVLRLIGEDEAAELKPPRRKEDQDEYSPDVGPALAEALNWFLLATAARKARGQVDDHSSMLVHVTHAVDPQQRLAETVGHYLSGVNPDDPALEELWHREIGRVVIEGNEYDKIEFSETKQFLAGVLEATEVIVDNGQSDVRLDYETDTPRTVVAVGGNTLSRGLTLEGLVVSYFTRSSNSYDSLLQMGRWFGFRKGYADLARIWMTAELKADFRHLATVEAEIREDIARYEQESITPQQLGLRIRTHPGGLSVTAPNKMFHAENVNVVYGGTRQQTFKFDLTQPELQRDNMKKGRDFIRRIRALGLEQTVSRSGARVLFRDVPAAEIARFLRSYQFHPVHRQLDNDALGDYIDKRAEDKGRYWNVAVLGAGDNNPDRSRVDLGLDKPVPAIFRARMADSPDDAADIKAIMSSSDLRFDLPAPSTHDDYRKDRDQQLDGQGLLILYPIDGRSPAKASSHTRKDLGSDEDVLGLGIVFPSHLGNDETSYEHEYVSVRIRSGDELDDSEDYAIDEEELDQFENDTEPDYEAPS